MKEHVHNIFVNSEAGVCKITATPSNKGGLHGITTGER